MACGEGCLVSIFNTIPFDELFLGVIELRPIEVLSATAAVRLVLIFDDTFTSRINGKAVPVFIDLDGVHKIMYNNLRKLKTT